MATPAQGWGEGAAFPKLKRAAWLAVAAMTMFFLALTFAYLQRHGLNTGWMSARLAEILSADTCLLLASSLALVRGREFLKARQMRATLCWTATAFGFGLAFLAGQAMAWRSLLSANVYVATHPNSAFFYLVTAAHAAHLLLALGLLAWVLSRGWRGRLQPDRPLLMEVTGIVWHCLDITWVYLYLVLLFYR
jgi:cytochrome c oxidase subunit 3